MLGGSARADVRRERAVRCSGGARGRMVGGSAQTFQPRNQAVTSSKSGMLESQ